MTDLVSILRKDLLAFDAQTLAAMSNRGLVKRAQKDLETGVGPLLDSADDAPGTVRGRFPDGVVAVFPPGAGLDASDCTCGSLGVCRHRICLVLAYQRAHAESEHSRASEPEAAEWSPGDVDDEALAALIGPKSLVAARRTFARGYSARVHRFRAGATHSESSDSSPWVELPACTVRFPVPGEAAHAITDVVVARRGEVIALAIWAFRAADATGDQEALIRVEVGGNAKRATESPELAAGDIPADALSPAVAVPRIPLAFAEALDVTRDLIVDGGSHADAVLSSTLFQIQHDLTAAGLHWPAAAFGEIIDQLEAYQSRSADYQHTRFARAIAELHARHRALGRAPLPAADILGTGETQAVPLRRTRLTALGARIRGVPAHRTAEVYFAQPQAGITLVLKRRWNLEPDQYPDPAQPTGDMLAARRIVGTTLGALATSNLVSETATRSPSRILTVSHSRIAPTAVLPVGAAWTELREPILVTDFARCATELTGQPPSFLRPRIEAESVRLLQVAEVSDIGYDVADQSLRAVIRDVQGASALLTAVYSPVCPGALDVLAEALSAEPRYLSGMISCAHGHLAVDPMAVLTDQGMIVPDFAPGDGSAALGEAVESSPAPIPAALAAALAALAELAGSGMRVAGGGATAGLAEAAEHLQRVGLKDCAEQIRQIPDALRQNGFDAAAGRWIDAYIHLSIAAEVHQTR